MSSAEPTIADLNARLDNHETRLTALEGPGPDPAIPAPPQGLQPPIFTTKLNPDRSVTSTWTPADGAAATEVHEFVVDPANTLKATLPVPTAERRSSVLAGGKNYTYAGRSKGPNGELSDFSQQVTLYVPASGETTTPTTPPTTPSVPSGAKPSDVLDLRFWTLMKDTGAQGDPDNVYPAGLVVADKFYVRQDGGVVFRAKAGGVHSPRSKFCRWELRQMKDSSWGKAAWPSSGSHSLEAVLAIDARGLSKRRRINGMQIHDGGDDVCQIMRHESLGLGFMHNDGKSWVSIDPSYQDGARFKCKIVAAANKIQVFYNDVKKVDVEKTGTGWYWKLGCYLQTDVPEWKEDPDATGEVVVWSYTMAGGAS